MRYSLIVIPVLLILFCACKNDKPKQATASSQGNLYAKRFSIQTTGSYTRVAVFGNRKNFDTSAVFVLYDSVKPNLSGILDLNFIKTPCKKMASLSCIYNAMFAELGSVDRIAAIDNIDYVNEPAVLQRFKSGLLAELARTPDIDLEKTLQIKPDVLFTFGMGNLAEDKEPRLTDAGIPVVIVIDHLEEHPLARAEWIRFFAAFTCQLNKADSIFAGIVRDYKDLQKRAADFKEHPTVFSEIRYGDVWYMPGGKSFMATLIKDAGGKYLWDDNQDAGSLPLSFEQVYERAVNADFWFNLPMIFDRKSLEAADERYTAFAAWKSGNIYNNTLHRNTNGYSNYWESGIAHPEKILSDLTKVLHPEISNANGELYYYEKLR